MADFDSVHKYSRQTSLPSSSLLTHREKEYLKKAFPGVDFGSVEVVNGERYAIQHPVSKKGRLQGANGEVKRVVRLSDHAVFARKVVYQVVRGDFSVYWGEAEKSTLLRIKELHEKLGKECLIFQRRGREAMKRYLLTPWVTGVPLRKFFSFNKETGISSLTVDLETRDPSTRLLAVKKLLAAMIVLWNQGYVHGDISPGNLMIDLSSPQSPEVEPIDFGTLYEAKDDYRFREGSFQVGTLGYLNSVYGSFAHKAGDFIALSVLIARIFPEYFEVKETRSREEDPVLYPHQVKLLRRKGKSQDPTEREVLRLYKLLKVDDPLNDQEMTDRSRRVAYLKRSSTEVNKNFILLRALLKKEVDGQLARIESRKKDAERFSRVRATPEYAHKQKLKDVCKAFEWEALRYLSQRKFHSPEESSIDSLQQDPNLYKAFVNRSAAAHAIRIIAAVKKVLDNENATLLDYRLALFEAQKIQDAEVARTAKKVRTSVLTRRLKINPVLQAAGRFEDPLADVSVTESPDFKTLKRRIHGKLKKILEANHPLSREAEGILNLNRGVDGVSPSRDQLQRFVRDGRALIEKLERPRATVFAFRDAAIMYLRMRGLTDKDFTLDSQKVSDKNATRTAVLMLTFIDRAVKQAEEGAREPHFENMLTHLERLANLELERGQKRKRSLRGCLGHEKSRLTVVLQKNPLTAGFFGRGVRSAQVDVVNPLVTASRQP